jgi:uroporphyrinogen-III synthase
MSFAGLRVVAFESRRATEIAELIRRQGGEPIVAPSMREAPLRKNELVFVFADRLFRGDFDMMILLTGVGTRALNALLVQRYPAEAFAEALRKIAVVARGPKPLAVLREMQIPAAVVVPEPNTWRELLTAIEGRPEKRIAVQEYGRSNTELLVALKERGAEVTPVRVYQWDLPEDTAPLRQAVQRIANGEAHVAVFTTSIQIEHVFRIADELGLDIRPALGRMMIASIGPTTSEALQEFDIHPDMMPSHPKMGFLIKEAAEQSRGILEKKRSG